MGNPGEGPELFIALVGAIGTDMDRVSTALRDSLAKLSYSCGDPIRLSELLHAIPAKLWEKLPGPGAPEDERYDKHMTAGNELRRGMNRGDALAMLAIGAIREERLNAAAASGKVGQSGERVEGGNGEAILEKGQAPPPVPGRAYILRSLKHPMEVETLHRIYGQSFFMIGAYAPRDVRLRELAQRIAASRHSNRTDEYLEVAQRLLKRDEKEEDEFGQNVRECFPMADVFVTASDPVGLQSAIARFVELIFGYPFHTPTRAEYAMFHAQAAALRSASLSRQVGAVIATEDGDIIAVGTNEVPRAGGGLYWCDDQPDGRDFRMGYDTSDAMKRNTLAEVLYELGQAKWLVEEKARKEVNELVTEALDTLRPAATAGMQPPLLKSTQLMDLIEFVRAQHAETAALMDAARRGVAVKGCNLYCTTFPCHDCAKHIVAAGIRRVYYIQPYPKSLAVELQKDSIAVDSPRGGVDKVSFLPFVGVAPRRYLEFFSTDLFSRVVRKQKDGKVVRWPKPNETPRFVEPHVSYSKREQEEFEKFERDRIKHQLV